MADVKPFGEFIPLEEFRARRKRPAGRGRQRDTYFEEIGLIEGLMKNIGSTAPVYRDSQGEIPKDDSPAAKKRQQSATTKIRRSLKAQEELPENIRPVFSTEDGVLWVALEEVSEETLRKREEAALKRAKARAR